MHFSVLKCIEYKASNPLPLADDRDRQLVNFGIWQPYVLVLSLDTVSKFSLGRSDVLGVGSSKIRPCSFF